MTTGTITSYDADTGRGYVQPDGTQDNVPFDADSLTRPEIQPQLSEGDRVRFEIQGGRTGLSAYDLRPIL